MVTKKILAEYDMLYMTDYYDYIIESFVNGQRRQGHEFYNRLSKPQREEMYDYFETLYHYEAEVNEPRPISELIQDYINTKLQTK